MKDLYKILEVPRTATQDEIKAAYRKKARELHPDINKDYNADEQFKELNEAYATLRDPVKKIAYDKELINSEENTSEKQSNGFSFSSKTKYYNGVSLATVVRCLNDEKIDMSTIIFHKGKPYKITDFDGAKVTFAPAKISSKQEKAFEQGAVSASQEDDKINFGDAFHFYMYDLLHSAKGITMLVILFIVIVVGIVKMAMGFAHPPQPEPQMTINPMSSMPITSTEQSTDIPANGTLMWEPNSALGNTPVDFSAAPGNDYYCVIIKNNDTNQRVVSFYIHPGKKVHSTMAAGNYSIYYTTFPKDQWFGPSAVGQNTPCAKCNIILGVMSNQKKAPNIELNSISDTNQDITQVSYEEFIQ